VFWTLLLTTVLTCGMAEASLFHIKTDGTKESGICLPGDWGPANCYPAISALPGFVGAGDTLLFFAEIHFFDTTTTLPEFMGNMRLDQTNDDTSLQCGPGAQLTLDGLSGSREIRGLSFFGDGQESDYSLIKVNGDSVTSGSLILNSCLFASLQGSDLFGAGGSCLELGGDGAGSVVEVSNCRFENNQTRGPGGAVHVGDNYVLVVSGSEFVNNESLLGTGQTSGRGGALAVISGNYPSLITFQESTLLQNKAWGPGGALFVEDSSLEIIDSELSGSESALGSFSDWSAGAGVLMRRMETHTEPIHLTVLRSTFAENIGHIDLNPWAGDGGAILVKGILGRYVDVEVSESVFRGNYSAQGAGIYIGRFATGSVSRCSFLENIAYLQGGATFKGGAFPENEGETAVYEYCEFFGNKAGLDQTGNDSLELGRGGAFSTRLYPRAEFYNCTFFNNTAHGPSHEGDAIMLPNEGGVFDNDLRKCQLVNCVFFGDVGNSRQVIVRTGALSLVSHCAAENQELQTGGLDPISPIILTAFPFAGEFDLTPGLDSPLIDSALDLGYTADILRNAVPTGNGPDVGAYEAMEGVSGVPGIGAYGLDLQAFPNPFNPKTILSFDLDEAARVSLDIFDVRGHRVARLHDGWLEAGKHEVPFSGLSSDGRALPSGIYLARLNYSKSFFINKLVLAR
jgi:hypothetical protein